MLRNLTKVTQVKVTQQRFKPGFLCYCKTAFVCWWGARGGAECSQEESLGISRSRQKG